MELVRLDRLTLSDLVGSVDSFFNQSDTWAAAGMATHQLAPRVAIDFNRAYAELGPSVRRIGIYRGRLSPNDADDFLHEVFQRVWEKRFDFRGESTTRAWIIGIAYNVARNSAKRYKPPTDPNQDCDALPSRTRITPEERAMHGEAEAQLTLTIARLSEYEQRLFVGFLSTDQSVTDTAALCGVNYDKASRDLIATRAKVAKIFTQLQRDNGWRAR